MRGLRPGLLLGLLVAPSAAQAHATDTSFLSLALPRADAGVDAPVGLDWDVPLQDVMWVLFAGTNGGHREPDLRPALSAAVLNQLSVQRGGADCALRVGELSQVKRADQSYLSVTLTAACPQPGLLAVGGGLFRSGDPARRALLTATRGTEQLTGALSTDAPTWTEPAQAFAWANFRRFVHEGAWHVLHGYDHLAFVLLLLLPAVMRPVDRRWEPAAGLAPVTREVVALITAFTVAHSITLALAVTGRVRLPAGPIEAAIALSIAVAAALNLAPRLAKLRAPLAFGFGLVHGFGFANALREIDRSGSSLLPLLAGFNVGVELAQIGLVLLGLPLLYGMRTWRGYASAVLPLGSCALGAAGLFWLLQRL